MAQCRFEFPVTSQPHGLVTQIRSHVGNAGGRFDGAESGSFALPTPVGTFRGTWEIIGRSIVVEVTDKPFFVPCSAIESRLADYVRGAG